LARVTIEDCLKNVPSRFALVHMAAQRVRQIREGADLLIKSSKNEDAVMALREIAANRIVLKNKPDSKG
jgi:DNA-directed RNA polymerase subunit omega